MTHQKRLAAPKHYPIKRKHQTYISGAEGSRKTENSIPALLFLREITQYADTKKEAKKIIREGNLYRNDKRVRDVREKLGTLDTVELKKTDEKYRIIKQKDSLKLNPVEKSEQIVAKVTDKRKEEDRFVYRLHNGENYSTEENYQTNSTLVIENNEVKEEIKMEEGSKTLVIKGKHSGKVGEITNIIKRGKNPDFAQLEQENGETFETQAENLVPVNKEVQGVEL